MRIAHLVAGAGPMYCGSCLHSNGLARALREQGTDVVLLPLYTPLRTDEEDVSRPRLAMGGVNVYLKEKWSLFQRMPRLMHWLLDRPGLVRWVARRGTRTRPETLGAIAVSMLRAEEGRLRTEVDQLLEWLCEEGRPSVVHLSNVLLAGLARPIRDRLRVPVVCSLSGEDIFLEKLPEPYYGEARSLLRERAADLAALVAMNGYYRNFMADYLAVPRERIQVIRPGLDLRNYSEPEVGAACRAAPGPARQAGPTPELVVQPAPADSAPITIGYFGRVCFDKGLHQLVEALCLLREDGETPVRVLAAGYLDRHDRPYLKDILRTVHRCGLADRFQYLGELDLAGKVAFLQSLDVLCLPTVYRESKGLPVLEAWACGVPAVLPAHGAFPEMIEDTGGGLLYEPGNPAALAGALRLMLGDRPSATEFGRRGREAVFERYTAERMARETLELYRRVVGE